MGVAGRRIVSLQTSLALLNSPQAYPVPEVDEYGRQTYTHPALNGLPGLTHEAKDTVLDKARLAPIASRYGLDKVTRWKPKSVRRESRHIRHISWKLTFQRPTDSKHQV